MSTLDLRMKQLNTTGNFDPKQIEVIGMEIEDLLREKVYWEWRYSPTVAINAWLQYMYIVCGSSDFRWSHDGKYFGRMTDNLLSIYEVPVSSYHRLLCVVPGWLCWMGWEWTELVSLQ